jgi:hypothetical protein
MRVLLIDVDSRIPNLALMKLSACHKQKGDEVGFDIQDPELVYISCIFSKNASRARGIATFYPDAEVIIGGSGISLERNLPDQVELIKPDYDLYKSAYSQGYTSRGCPRDCGFCIVPQKEGAIRTVQYPGEFHDDRFDTCMIMDNNLFATPNSWQDRVFNWFIENDVKMLAPQGWDIRLLTSHRSRMLWMVKWGTRNMLHFAWDNPSDEERVVRGVDILKSESYFDLKHEVTFYVLAGYNTTFEQDVYRCEKLRDMGIQAYLMRYRRTPDLNALARWTAKPALYWSFPFGEYTRKKVKT